SCLSPYARQNEYRACHHIAHPGASSHIVPVTICASERISSLSPYRASGGFPAGLRTTADFPVASASFLVRTGMDHCPEAWAKPW
ncbi:MAG TPA: hypothetical protein PLW35_06350, partial [Verrucomicrobiota bacterium]|nr:hypothetical protein [Verrucomicrobiota bacterium]